MRTRRRASTPPPFSFPPCNEGLRSGSVIYAWTTADRVLESNPPLLVGQRLQHQLQATKRVQHLPDAHAPAWRYR